MRTTIAIAMILTAGAAHAVNGPPPTPSDPGQAQGQAQGQLQGQAQLQGQVQGQIQGQEATATGGNAVADGGDSSNAVSVNNGDDYDAPAPAVVAIPPVSTMDCIRGFALGGSNQNGGIAAGPTWKDRDCVAEKTFQRLADMDLYVPAARSYCARPRHAEPFGSRDDCEAQITQALIDADTPAENTRLVYWPEDTQCKEALQRCETTVGGK